MSKLTLTIQIQIDHNRLLEIYNRVSGGKSFFVYDDRVYRVYGGRFTNDIYNESVELTLNRDEPWTYPEAIFEPYRGKDCLP